MKSLILLNGPPRCGKDTAGAILGEQIEMPWMTEKFSAALKDATHLLYRLAWPCDHYEDTKDVPTSAFLGLTPRQAYIGVSERYMKPTHGEDVFGRFLAESIQRSTPNIETVIITDSGFLAEARHVAALAERVLAVRIHREGCTFDGDSRSYWPVPNKWECVEVVNPGDMDGFRRVLEPVVEWVSA
jgi:hypothetical protein